MTTQRIITAQVAPLDPANIVDQAYSGLTIALTYAASLTPGAAVYLNSSGNVDKANATGVATAPAIGLAMETFSSGVHVVLLDGIYRDDSLLSFSTVGGAVYLATTAGVLTQSQPSATDQVIQVIGYALATHILYVNPQLDYLTHT
jgi:hypothetical protein